MKPAFVIYGNCQAAVLQDILRSVPYFASRYDTIYYQSFDHPTDGVSVIDPGVMARCEILWCQSDDNTPFNFDGPTPSEMRTITFPSVDLGVLWPNQAADPIFTREELYPYGMFPYGDRMLMQIAQEGLTAEAGMARFEQMWTDSPFPFERYLDIELQRLVRREQGTQVKLAAYVLSHFRTDRLLWSYNHPTSLMFSVLLNRLILATFPESRQNGHELHRLGDAIFRDYDPFSSSYQAPIFPGVAQALGLQWWSPDDRYYFHHDERMTYPEFVERYLQARVARQRA